MRFPIKLSITSDCIVTNIKQSIRDEIKTELTLPNPAYVGAKKAGRYTGHMPHYLEYFDESGTSLLFPRGFTESAIEIINELSPNAEIIISLDTRTFPKVKFKFHGKARDYQIQAIESILKHDMGVLQAPTGSGKTTMALAIIAARKQPTLILVHNKELMNQWAERCWQYLKIKPTLIGDGNLKISNLTIGVVNSVRKHVNNIYKNFGMLVVDECHRVPSTLFTDSAGRFDCKYILGLTATPIRNDGLGKIIFIYMGGLRYSVDKKLLENNGAILKPEIYEVHTDYEYIRVDNELTDYSKMLSDLTKNRKRNKLITQVVLNELNINSGTALIVTDRVQQCLDISAILNENNQPSEVLTGQLNNDERKKIVNKVQKGEVEVLLSTIQLIGEGFDCPGLSSIYLATPMRFEGRIIQSIGRILRPKEGKTAKVFDFMDFNVRMLAAGAKHRRKIYKKW